MTLIYPAPWMGFSGVVSGGVSSIGNTWPVTLDNGICVYVYESWWKAEVADAE